MITVPTAKEIADKILSDLEGSVGQTSPFLPKAFLRVLSATLGGVVALLLRVVKWAYLQIFVTTADEEALFLKGQEYGMGPNAGQAAILSVQIIGTPGQVVPAGTVWTGDNGLAYAQDYLSTIGVSGIVDSRFTCLEAGLAGSIAPGGLLAVASPLGGIDGASVVDILVEGEDPETTEQFRARLEQRIAGQPQGGSAADYIRWAMEVPGIVRAFAFRTNAGEVTVYPLQATTGVARIPAAGKITEVDTYIDNVARRPLCADVITAAMTEKTVNITTTTLNPGDDGTKAAIVAAWQNYLWAAYPRQYPDEVKPTHVIDVDALRGLISDAGASCASLVMTVVGTGAVTRYELGNNEIAKLGTPTWA